MNDAAFNDAQALYDAAEPDDDDELVPSDPLTHHERGATG